jgi:hypothetical protein
VDIDKLLGELRAERDQIQDAIDKLERLAEGRSRRRGRPPAWRTTEAVVPARTRRGRPRGSKSGVRPSGRGAPPDSGMTGASGA